MVGPSSGFFHLGGMIVMMTYTVMEISEGDDGAAERKEGTSDLECKTVHYRLSK